MTARTPSTPARLALAGAPSRRRLLQAAAVLAAARLAHAAPGARAPRLRKCLKIGMIQEGDTLAERFRVAREVGFEGVELDSPNDLSLDEVLAAREATGIEVPGVVDSLHWRKPLSSPDADVRDAGRAALETALRDAAAYGASTVLLVPAVVNQRVPYDAAYERSQAEIRAVLPLAEELGVKIAIENVWNQFLLSPLEAARYVDELESPMVGWYMDVGNVVNHGWPEQWIRILGPRILKLDVKEFSRKKRDDDGLWEGFRVELGEGDCDWPAVLAALDEVGYSGWASAEVPGGDRRRLADVSRRMDRVLTPA